MSGPWPQGDERREAIVLFIREYWDTFGISPSVDEIAQGVGLASKTAARHHLAVLSEQGLVVSTPGKYRSIRLTTPRRRRTVGHKAA